MSALSEIKYSESAYLEQIFRTRMVFELSEKKIEAQVQAIRQAEKAKLKNQDLDDMSQEPGLSYEQNIQVKISQFVNEKIAALGSTIHESFLQTHGHNTLTIEQRVKRENYHLYIDSLLDRLIASGHKSNPIVIELRKEFNTFLQKALSAKIMMVDDELELPEYDKTRLEVILLDNSNRVRVKYTNITKIYQKMVEQIFKENAHLTTILSKVFTACGIIKRVGDHVPLSEESEKKVLSLIMNQLYCQPVRYKEIAMPSFMYYLQKDNSCDFYWAEYNQEALTEIEILSMPPGQPVDFGIMEEMLEIRRFSPFLENASIYEKLKI